MKIGFVSRIGEFPEKEWKKEFDIAKKYGFSHLELIINYPFLGPSTYTQEQRKYINELSKKSKMGLILHLLPNQYGLSKKDILKMGATTNNVAGFLKQENYLKGRIFNIASPDEKVRNFSIDEIRKTIDIAKELNSKLITIHGGSFDCQANSQQYLQIARKTLEQLNLKSGDVKLAIENLPTLGHFGNPPNELPIYAKDLNYLVNGLDNIFICYDIGHANTVEDPISFYEKIAKTNKILNMHLHDNKGDKDDHLPFGQGNIGWERFFQKLKQDNYHGYLSIELDTWPEPPEPMTADERIKGLEYLKKII